MEHQDAIETYAAEGYLLDELTDAERDAFEQHFADCESCFADVRDGVRFIHALPEAVKDERAQPRHRWDLAMAASLAVIATAAIGQYGVVAPMQAQLAELRTPRIERAYTLGQQVQRGNAQPNVVNGHAGWPLEFDIVNGSNAPYTCTIVNDRGQKWRVIGTITADQVRQPVKISMPPGALPPGNYSLIVTGAGGVPEEPIGFTVQ
jgi:hypothetical protein